MEECQGRRRVIGGIVECPDVLIEGLENSWFPVGCCQDLANPKAVREFTIGKVGDDLAWAPFAGCDWLGDLFGM